MPWLTKMNRPASERLRQMCYVMPCPFCASDEQHVLCGWGDDEKPDDDPTYIVACSHCSSTGPGASSVAEAAQAWNYRAQWPAFQKVAPLQHAMTETPVLRISGVDLMEVHPKIGWNPWYEVASAAHETVKLAYLSGRSLAVEGWRPLHRYVTDLHVNWPAEGRTVMNVRFVPVERPLEP